jgi:hypothetical protein
VAQLYETSAAGSECPGEENCQFFQQSAEPKYCPVCPVTHSPEEFGVDAIIVDRVERLVSEKSSGREIDVSDLDPLEWELVKYWDRVVAAYERAHQVRLAQIVEGLIAR